MADSTHTPLLRPSEFRKFEDIPTIVGVICDGPGPKSAEFADLMVRCSDGGVRRFPPPEKIGPHSSELHEIRQGNIYDIPAKYVTNHIGGIKVSEDGKSAAFEVNGFAVSPVKVANNVKAYPLPNGRVLVPQTCFNDSSKQACSLMMLLDQGHQSLGSTSRYTAGGSRFHQMETIREGLEAETGQKAMLVEHDLNYKTGLLGAPHASRKQAWLDLGAKINEMGPCILNKDVGHTVMLDGVRESGGKIHLTIRDPFHGTSVEFRDTAKFFNDSDATQGKMHSIQAIFLKPQGAS